MEKISGFIRSIILVALVVICAFLCGLRLLQIQLVDGENYLGLTKQVYVAEQEVDAARGQIVDCNGKVMQSNKISYDVSLQYTTLPKDDEKRNEIIYRVLSVLNDSGEDWNESLPISKTKPYAFVAGKDKAVETLKQRLNIANYATVDDCIFQLYKTYEISDKYDEQMRRRIAGVRYEMTLKDFSYRNKFVLASDIGLDTVMEIKELSNLLDGVDITESWERQYLDGDIAPHLRGTVGAISAEQYAELKDDGYTFNDSIGLSGIEKALENELRGTRGVRSITRSHDGKEISDEITVQPVAGKSVMLTLDSNLQKLVQQALEYHITYLQTEYYNPAFKDDPELLKEACRTGAVVVLDVKTGGVLACASYPNYDLNDYVSDYDKVISAEDSPVFNRALDGVFRPGSTFKTITATAGLAEGAITSNSVISCGGTYYYYAPGFTPSCMNKTAHGSLTVRTGLMHSCNIFFYETARRTGIDKLAEWAGRYGVGKDLNFEIAMQTGQMTSLELYEKLGLTWNPGDIIQAGIGQCETGLTPLHLAVQAATIANKGVRLEPHIVKSVYNYDFTEKLYDKDPVVADDFSDYPGMSSYMEDIRQGMIMVSGTSSLGVQGIYNVYDYVGAGQKNVATKTGSPQTSETVFNSALIGFYPADDPEIAFGMIIERGEKGYCIGANIISAYSQGKISGRYDENGVPNAWL